MVRLTGMSTFFLLRSATVVCVLVTLGLAVACGTDQGGPRATDDGTPSAAGSPGEVSSGVTEPQQPGDASGDAPASGRPDQGVFGHVTDGRRPVIGAMIQPAPGPGNDAPERESFATSAEDGAYGLGLTPGVWEITISADGYQPATQQVTVPDSGVVRVDVRLEPAQ